MLAVEEPVSEVRIALAVPQPSSQEAVAPRHLVGLEARRLELVLDAFPQCVADTLVRVNGQHPAVFRLVCRKPLLPAVSQPVLAQHARAAALGDFEGGVSAAGINHEDFIGKCDALETGV